MNAWPLEALDNILSYKKIYFTIDNDTLYMRCRVQLHAKGVVLRDKVEGVGIKTKRQQLCERGDFLVAEIDAKLGGFGVVPEELHNAIVSSHYFLFSINTEKVLRRFFEYYCMTRYFFRQIEAQGSTNYASIRANDILSYKMPLPTITEQKNIVSQLDALTDKIQQVEEHLDAAETKAEQLLMSRFQQAIRNALYKTMAEVAPIVRRAVVVDLEAHYSELGIRSFGKGTFHKPSILGSDLGSKRLFRIEPGDLLFSNVFAWEGAIAIARAEDQGRFGSHRFITCLVDNEIALASFLRYYLLSSEGMEKINEASPGGAGRNRTLGLNKLMQISIPLPSLAKQREFDRLYTKITELKSKHTAIRAGLAKLMPAMLELIFCKQASQTTDSLSASAIEQQRPDSLFSLVPEPNRLHQKAAIATYITNVCHDGDFGKTKLAKCYYLLHERLSLGLTADFQREAAGPWDKEQDAFLDYAAQQGWLKLPPAKRLPANDAKGERSFKAVLDGQKIQKGVEEALGIIGSERRSLAEELLGEMKKMHWELLERWATVLDAAKTLQAQGKNVTASTVCQFIASIPKWATHKLQNKPQHYTLQSINEAFVDLRKWGFMS